MLTKEQETAIKETLHEVFTEFFNSLSKEELKEFIMEPYAAFREEQKALSKG